jgi:hypothetical protein
MARIFPQKYIQKIEDIKRLVLIRSKLLSEFGNEGVKMELDDYSYDQKLDIFHELIFTIDLKYIDCDDCDIEIDSLADTIKNYNDKIINGSRFKVTSKLDIVNGDTTRGVLLSEISYKFSEIQKLSFGLFIDPDVNF